MIRVLFVDDEPNILQALKRMLRTMRAEWDMEFCNDAAEALDSMSRSRFDVIVTDMRMPKMNGAQLLTTVRNRFPWVVRIALSGHTDHELIVQAVAVAHQFLAKPCDFAVLRETITEACILRDVVADREVRERICRAQCVPSQSESYNLLMRELQSEHCTTTRVSQIINSDVGMSAKVLNLVNSAFFGTPRHVCDPPEAVAMLGIDTLRELATAGHVFCSGSGDRDEELDLDIWTISALTARICSEIADRESLPKLIADAAQTSAFLHRIGGLIGGVDQPPLGQDEEAAAGAYLLSLWGFNADIIEAAGWYRKPSDSPLHHGIPAAIVHVGCILARDFVGDETGCGYEIDRQYLAEVGFGDRLVDWRGVASQAVMNGVYK